MLLCRTRSETVYRRTRMYLCLAMLLLALIPEVRSHLIGVRSVAAQSASSNTVTLSLGSWDDENGSKRHIAAIAEFEKQYPNIKVSLQQFIGSDWQTQILSQILSGDLPDVYMVDSSSIPLYV